MRIENGELYIHDIETNAIKHLFEYSEFDKTEEGFNKFVEYLTNKTIENNGYIDAYQLLEEELQK